MRRIKITEEEAGVVAELEKKAKGYEGEEEEET
jgi:hypothetical protein